MKTEKAVVVRWLGAFRAGESLSDSLTFELSRPMSDEVAAEMTVLTDPQIKWCRVGLLVKRRSVKVRWRGDVWSERGKNGRLYRTASRPNRHHTEVWCRPDYSAIVVRDFFNLRKKIKIAVIEAAIKYRISVVDIYPRDGWADNGVWGEVGDAERRLNKDELEKELRRITTRSGEIPDSGVTAGDMSGDSIQDKKMLLADGGQEKSIATAVPVAVETDVMTQGGCPQHPSGNNCGDGVPASVEPVLLPASDNKGGKKKNGGA